MNILFYDNGKIHRKLSGSDYTEPDYTEPVEPSQRLFYHASPPREMKSVRWLLNGHHPVMRVV